MGRLAEFTNVFLKRFADRDDDVGFGDEFTFHVSQRSPIKPGPGAEIVHAVIHPLCGRDFVHEIRDAKIKLD